jgi:hypothetical protein
MSQGMGEQPTWARRVLLTGVIFGIASLGWNAARLILLVTGAEPVSFFHVAQFVIQVPLALLWLYQGRSIWRRSPPS